MMVLRSSRLVVALDKASLLQHIDKLFLTQANLVSPDNIALDPADYAGDDEAAGLAGGLRRLAHAPRRPSCGALRSG